MNQELRKIQSFTDLTVWQERHKLVIDIHKITQKVPKEEQGGLTNQVRQAIVSCTSNSAEGFSRHSYKEKVQFYSMALGSLTEVQNQLLISRDLGYISKEDFQKRAEQTVLLSKLINGLIKKSKTILHDS